MTALYEIARVWTEVDEIAFSQAAGFTVEAESRKPVTLGTDDFGPVSRSSMTASRDYETFGAWTASQTASRPSDDPPVWRQYIADRLEQIAEQGVTPGYPARETLRAAWNITIGLFNYGTPTPSVVPGEEGAVELIWRRGGWHIELEIGTSGASVWARDRESGETLYGPLSEVRYLLRDILALIARPG